ncbi:hypothetical protein TRFO_38134 [Tritrichomonas foetus]|uniref:G domain-containing protein n=1 Tax=Tritrichomonas foetus TaxID=1144522 RepID=A0A1J4J979_9EUKA|nr:hypothetical protein TRFO_38134 [Tritrichomonas foetus]|eukprot:OHS95746.1 hypothetical protein TRFO_38134 [Tritrichomonas foetus]
MPPKKNSKGKKNSGGFGAALINSKTKKRQKVGEGNHGPTKYSFPDTEVALEDRLRSMTDDYTLGDFVTDAELNGKTFEAIRGNIRIVDRQQLTKEAFESLHRTPEQIEAEDRLKSRLIIPRRPYWDENTTPEELHEKETSEILEWRRALSVLEESDNIVLSPFEKNPEVWKELWRVLERSQVAIYIVDSRDPLAFFSHDFIKYMNELDLPVLLALNKADLVPQPIRDEWAQYFQALQTDLGFSFKFEFVSTLKTKTDNALTPKELVLKGKTLAKGPGRDGKVTIGFVGFPNVGKSSMLNSAVGRICVRSSMTPGKTKHLQTINMEEDGITVCDCPGLVFPLFQQSRAAMICNGVLSIDQMTDWLGPCQILCQKIPSEALNALYSTRMPPPYCNAHDFLQNIAKIKGFTTARANPDEARAARLVLKDYVAGKLIHCELPPGVRLKPDEVPVEKNDNDENDMMDQVLNAPERPVGDVPAMEEVMARTPVMPVQQEKKPVVTSNPKRRGVVRIATFE